MSTHTRRLLLAVSVGASCATHVAAAAARAHGHAKGRDHELPRARQPKDGELLWTTQLGYQEGCETSLAADGTDVFVADIHRVYKLDGRSGAQLWNASCFKRVPTSVTPSLTEKLLVVPGDEGILALDRATGARAWDSPALPGETFTSSASYSPDGEHAYVGCGWDSDCEAVTCVSTDDGHVVWRFAPKNTSTSRTHTFWAKVVVTSDNMVIVGDFGGHLWALRGETGSVVWHFDEMSDRSKAYGNEIWPSVALFAGEVHLVFTSNLGWIRKFEVATGREVQQEQWPISPGTRKRDHMGPNQRDPIIFGSPVIDRDGTVYLTAENWCVYAFDGETGVKKWAQCTFCSWGSAGPLLREDGLLIYAADLSLNGTQCPPYIVGCDPPSPGKAGSLIAMNTSDGSVVWSTRIPGMHTFICNEQIPNMLADGTIVIGGGTYGGVSAFASAANLDTKAAWPKFGYDRALSGGPRAAIKLKHDDEGDTARMATVEQKHSTQSSHGI